MNETNTQPAKLLITTRRIASLQRSSDGEQESLTSRGKSEAVEIIETTGGEMGARLAQICLDISSKIEETLAKVGPKEFEIEMNLGFEGKTNFVLAELGASSGIKVTMKW